MALQTTHSQAELPTWSLAEPLQVTSLVGAELAPGGTEQNRCPLQAAAFAQVRSAPLPEKGEGGDSFYIVTHQEQEIFSSKRLMLRMSVENGCTFTETWACL